MICLSLSGKTTDEALNLELFGYPSDMDLFDTELESEGSSLEGKCPACNGSGTIRYNYGSSDLEAWLTGHDAYTLDTCPMCHGRGWV